MKKRIAIAVVFLFVVFIMSMSTVYAAKSAKITWISVGAGDAVLVEAPGGEKILVDGGLYSKGDKVCKLLKKKGIKKLDYVINTHSHQDHADGLVKVFRKYKVKNFYYDKKCSYKKGSDKYVSKYAAKLLAAAKSERDCNIVKPDRGDLIECKLGFTIEFVQPEAEYDSINENSLALILKYGKKKVLLTGDVSKGAEKKIKKYNVDVCDLPHHGAANGTSKAFIKRFDPEYVVVSADGKTWGHPSRKTFKRLKAYSKKLRIFRTFKDGNIQLTMTKKKIKFADKGVLVGTALKQTKNP